MSDTPLSRRVTAQLYSKITGRTQAEHRSLEGLSGQLRSLGGASRRTKSGIDVKAAAGRLGVSTRTVQRWLKADRGEPGGSRPSAGHAAQLAQRSWSAAVEQRRQRLADGGSGQLTITGLQGPTDRSYFRNRTVSVELDPEQLEEMLNAYEDGKESAFLGWASNQISSQYVDDWKFGEVENVDITFRR